MNLKTLSLILAVGYLITRATRKKGVMLSKNFSLDEFTKSRTAIRLNIDNKPGVMEIANIQALVDNVLQPLRDAMGFPIIIGSGYRSQELNQTIGGAYASQHMAKNGAAADIDVGNKNRQVYDYIKNNLPFDQLIYEAGNPDLSNPSANPGWVHVSYKSAGNRYQVLQYIPGQGYKDI
tara:strand:- start:123 stop:656 length:534 start_codon:yes stop_codon:yes gene_type:complete